jgi:ABC-type multidrug transport system fused ATPase/permease subunit
MRPDAVRWCALGALLAVGSTLALGGPLVVRTVVDRATEGTTAAELVRLGVVYLLIALVAQALSVIVAWFATITAWRTTNQVRMHMVRHVLGLDHEFHRRHTPGELIQRVDGDVTSVSDFLGRVVPRAAGAGLLVVGITITLTVIDWRLGLGAIVYVVVATLIVVRRRHGAVRESSDEMGSYARLYGGIEERLTAAEDLRANGAGPHAMWRFIEESADTMQGSVRREHAFLTMWWAVQGSVAGGTVVTLAASAVLVANDAITVGTAFLLLQYVLLLGQPLEDLVDQLETVQKANGAMVRVIDLLAVRTAIDDTGTVSPPAGPLSIECIGLGFDYGDDEAVLRDVDLRIEPGRSVGIVGRTGSGKTTFSRLVLRLVEATRGELRLGGVPIADIPLAELRHRVALVPQEVELFSGTIRDNVTLYDDAPSDDDVADALRRVGLDALVDGGIHRELGAGGTGLSAGEAQLLALARVWLRRPDVVVLDEATARVDPETEQRLEAAITELMRGRTTLIIAHRLSTLHRVENVVVFDHGRVVEHDDRAHLAATDGSRFRQLLDLALDDEQVERADRGTDAPPAAAPEVAR